MSEPFDAEHLVADLVAVLFVAGEGADRRALQQALQLSANQLERVIRASAERIPGLLVQQHGELVRLVTHPDVSASVRRFTQTPNALRLSAAAIESLAVIAYSQPTTRSQVQDARGVNSDGAIATLIQHGLIEETGRADSIGHPALFSVTADCLTLLGLGSLADLPSLGDGQSTAPPHTPNEDSTRGTIIPLRAHASLNSL